jgi:hypothetical protein
MKRIFIFIVLFSSVFVSKNTLGQIVKGTRFIKGGELSISSDRRTYKHDQDSYRYKSSSMSISSGVGYFIMNNLSVGIDLRYSSAKVLLSGYYYVDEVSGSDFSFGPFVRYYLGGKVFLGSGYQHSLSNKDDFPIEFGGAIFLKDRISIEPTIKLFRPFISDEDTYLSIGASLSIYLNKKN